MVNSNSLAPHSLAPELSSAVSSAAAVLLQQPEGSSRDSTSDGACKGRVVEDEEEDEVELEELDTSLSAATHSVSPGTVIPGRNSSDCDTLSIGISFGTIEALKSILTLFPTKPGASHHGGTPVLSEETRESDGKLILCADDIRESEGAEFTELDRNRFKAAR